MNWREILTAYGEGMMHYGRRVGSLGPPLKRAATRAGGAALNGADIAYGTAKRSVNATNRFFARHPRVGKGLVVGGVAAMGAGAAASFAHPIYDTYINEGILGSPGATGKLLKSGLYEATNPLITAQERELPADAGGAYAGANGSYQPRGPVPTVNFTPRGRRYTAPSGDIVFGMYNLRK